ncbi:Glyceraldehyde 3-phosphate phosphatase [uncultured archaeon]|nr:Glyceraldehyde 3-phosphate phosphatase [uncultured archaeon]
MLKSIIFDLDNTLVNFWQFKQESAREASAAMVAAGLPMTEQGAYNLIFKIYEQKGVEYQLVFTDMIKPFNFPKAQFEKIRDAGIVAYLRKKGQVLKPYPGIPETLAELKKSYSLAVLTDAAREQAHQRLNFTGLAEYFEQVGTFHDTNIYKPGTEPFLSICKKLNVQPSECLMVGDNPGRDMKGAQAVGMKTCLAKYDPYFESAGPHPDFSIEQPADLLEVVRRIG